MKKLYVSTTLFYGYEIEIPDELATFNDSALRDIAIEKDPLGSDTIWGIVDNPITYINSIFDDEGNEYYSE